MTDQYIKNINNVFKVFKIVGIYCPKGSKIGCIVIGTIVRLLFIKLTLFLETLEFSRVENIFEFADLLSIYICSLSVYLKSYIVAYKIKDVNKLINEMRELIKFAREGSASFGKHIEQRMTVIKKFFTYYWCSAVFAMVVGTTGSIIFNKEPPYKLSFKMYSPKAFNYEYNYSYFLTLTIYQFISPLFSSTAVIAIDFLITYFFSMGAGFLEELTDRFTAIEIEMNAETKSKLRKISVIHVKKLKKEHENKTLKELNLCIEIHTRIKKFLLNTQNLVSPMIFVQLICNITIICMICYTISMVSIDYYTHSIHNLLPSYKHNHNGDSLLFRQIAFLQPMIMQIYIPCFFGNQITAASERFLMEIFHTKWFCGSRNFKKAFSILVIGASKPIVLVSGMIFQNTLGSFITVCNLAYKFFAVMQKGSQKRVL